MVRILSGIALLSIVVIALYLPSQFPAEKFFSHLREEHDRNSRFWGDKNANEILARALDIDEMVVSSPAAIAPSVVSQSSPNSLNLQTHLKLDEMRERFVDSSYVRGLRATLLLAEYRISALMQWAPGVALFVLLALIDGQIVRIVRSYEFGDHSPVSFGVFAFTLIALLWLITVSLLLPTAIHPLWYGVVPIVLGAVSGVVVANFHRSAMKPRAA